MKKLKNIDNLILMFISLIVFIVFWELLVIQLEIPKYVLPRPTTIFTRGYALRELLVVHTKITLYEAVVGLFLSLGIALIIAIILDLSQLLHKLVYPWMIISQTIPLTAVAPLFIIWFGFSSSSKILVVLLVCFFPLVVNILTGFKEVDSDLIDLMKVMKANQVHIYSKVKIPHAIPYILSGLKISTTYAVLAAVIGEWMGGRGGLGIFMSRTLRSFDTPGLFAIIFVIMFISLFLIFIVQLVEQMIIKWK